MEGICLCPAGTRPSVKSENCETFEQRKSSIQQEQNKKEYSKYANKIPRMQSGPIGKGFLGVEKTIKLMSGEREGQNAPSKAPKLPNCGILQKYLLYMLIIHILVFRLVVF